MIGRKDFDFLTELFQRFFRKKLQPLFLKASKEKQDFWEKPREGMGAELVSKLDKNLEKCYFNFLNKYWPDFQIISEESNPIWPPTKNDCWVIDPLDGTHNALAGVPTFGTMCAWIRKDKVLFSAIFLPTKEILSKDGIYIAGLEQGAWELGISKKRPINVSEENNLQNAFLLYEGPTKKVNGSKLAKKTKQQSRRHRYGLSSCWSGVLLASSSLYSAGFSALLSVNNKPWDNLPLCLLIEEAKGEVTDFQGNSWSLENCSSLIFSNKAIHDQILALNKRMDK